MSLKDYVAKFMSLKGYIFDESGVARFMSPSAFEISDTDDASVRAVLTEVRTLVFY